MALLCPLARFAEEDEPLVDQLDQGVDGHAVVGILEVLGELVGGGPDDGQPLTPDGRDDVGLGLGHPIRHPLDELAVGPAPDPFALVVPAVIPAVLGDRAVALDVVLATQGPDAEIGPDVFGFEGRVVVLADCHQSGVTRARMDRS